MKSAKTATVVTQRADIVPAGTTGPVSWRGWPRRCGKPAKRLASNPEWQRQMKDSEEFFDALDP